MASVSPTVTVLTPGMEMRTAERDFFAEPRELRSLDVSREVGGTSRPPNRRGMEKEGNKVKFQTYSRETSGGVVSWAPWSAPVRAT